jgi:hypothetical protein
MVVLILLFGGLDPLQPVEFGHDTGSGFVFSTLDADAFGRVKVRMPLDSTMALKIDQDVPGVGEVVPIWDLTGSDIHEEAPFDVPLFFATNGGPLGMDFGTLLPPPTTFSPGQVLTIADGRLAGWTDPRFIDTTGVPGLPDFVALYESLPNFTGNVTVSDVSIRVEGVVPEPSSAALVAIGLVAAGCACRIHKRIAS